jgi:hypothetical protein
LKFGKNDGSSPERVGLDNIGPGFQISAVNSADYIRPSDDQELRAILLAEIVLVKGKRRLVDHRAHGAIENEDMCRECVV